MRINGRSFPDEILAARPLLGLTLGESSPQSQPKGATSPPGTYDSISFWNQFYDNPSRSELRSDAPGRAVCHRGKLSRGDALDEGQLGQGLQTG